MLHWGLQWDRALFADPDRRARGGIFCSRAIKNLIVAGWCFCGGISTFCYRTVPSTPEVRSWFGVCGAGCARTHARARPPRRRFTCVRSGCAGTHSATSAHGSERAQACLSEPPHEPIQHKSNLTSTLIMVLNGSDYQNTLLILLIELAYTLTPKLLIHRKYTGMTQTLDCVIRSCLG